MPAGSRRYVNSPRDFFRSLLNEIKRRYPTASVLADNRVVFNLKGNKYRMLVEVGYQAKLMIVEKLGTHAEYSKWQL